MCIHSLSHTIVSTLLGSPYCPFNSFHKTMSSRHQPRQTRRHRSERVHAISKEKVSVHYWLLPWIINGKICTRQVLIPFSLILLHVCFFFWWCYSYGPQQGPDRQQQKKRREGSSRGESKRKLLKETQNQGKETRKMKRIQVEYRVEGAQDRWRRRKPGGWKETPNTRKRGGDAQSCSCSCSQHFFQHAIFSLNLTICLRMVRTRPVSASTSFQNRLLNWGPLSDSTEPYRATSKTNLWNALQILRHPGNSYLEVLQKVLKCDVTLLSIYNSDWS
jgi:hypothetical protein